MKTRFEEEYAGARGTAMTLPTWMLRWWERRVVKQLASGAPIPGAQARLLALWGVLRDREFPS